MTTTTITQTAAAPNWGKGVMSSVAGHSRPVNTLAWNSEGKLLASGSDDKTALVFSVSSASAPKQTAKLDGHGDSVVQLCWEPSAASNLATLAADRTVRLWDVRTRSGPTASIKVNHEYINCSWSGDGRTIAVGSSVGAKDDNVKDCVSLIDARTLRVMKLLKFPYEVNEFCWSPDSSHLLLTTEHGTVEVLCTRSDGGEKKSMNAATLKAHTDDCYCVALDAGTATLAVGSKDSLVSIWDLYECACVRTIARHFSPVRCVTLSSGAEYVASSAYEPGIEIASARTGELLHSIEAGHAMNSLAFHPTRSVLALAIDTKANAATTADRRGAKEDVSHLRLFHVPTASS